MQNDSRKVKKGDTFIAIKGSTYDGHDYIEEAINKGAIKIIAQHGNYEVETEIVKDTSKYYNEYIYNKYYEKIKNIKLIGVTGTNGKTTIAYLIYQMLNKMNIKAAYIGTIGFYHEIKEELDNTTPNIEKIYEMLVTCQKENIQYVVMEASSHALKQNRLYGLKFDAAIFTNLTQDHLDYHKTYEDYINSKQILFKNLRNKKIAILNCNDQHYKSFIFDNHNVTIGPNGDIKINEIILKQNETIIKFDQYEKRIKMIGEYNAYNYLEAIITLKELGFSINELLEIDVLPPPGRMQLIEYKTNQIFIDYAHTPDAIQNVLKCINEVKTNKVITIFGCGGNRDKTKRKIMGEIASNNSDYVIVTDDNPRNEDPTEIINDIIKGITNENYEIINDRKKAIEKGIDVLNENDILLILGKGHENYQIIKNVKFCFDDYEIAKNHCNNT